MRLLHVLKSRKSAVYLLTIITAVLIIGSFLPNPAYVTQAEAERIKNSQVLSFLAKFTPIELSKTWFFYVLFSVLSLSVIVCTLDRIRCRSQLPKRAKTIAEAEYQGNIEDAYLTLSQNLKRGRWQVRVGEGNSEIFAEKGYLGFWGSIAFHVSILLMVLGGVLTASESLLAGIVVTEGQTLPVSAQTIVDKARLPRFGDGNTGLTLRLDTFRPELSNGTAVKYTASLAVFDAKGNESYADVGINDALTFKGHRFMLQNYGFAPLLVIEDTQKGKVIIDAYVNLMGRESFEHDLIGIPETDVSFRTYVYPDFARQGDQVISRSVMPNNPVYKLVYIKGNELGKEVYLPLNDTVVLENYRISFKDLRYWVNLGISSDPGEWPMFAGIILACIGLAIRFLDPRRVLYFKLSELPNGPVKVEAGGYHSYTPEIFKAGIEEILKRVIKQ